MIKNFEELVAKAKSHKMSDGSTPRIAVHAADDEEVLAAVAEARNSGVANAYLVGDEKNIRKVASEHNIDLKDMEIINEPDFVKAGEVCTKLVNDGKAAVMMKGLVGTADFMKAVLNKEKGLRTGRLLSHFAIYELPTYHKLLGVSDAAINISPTVSEKVDMVKNGCDILRFLGVKKPKVAAICAVEKVNAEKMPSTAAADQLSKMAKAGELGDIFLDGPFALDVAISKHSAHVKKLDHLSVAGDADFILTHDIEAGNALYKSLNFFGQGKQAAVVCGAKVPLVLTSRADSHETKYFSIVLAIAARA